MSSVTDIPIAVGNSLGVTNPADALFIGGLLLSSAVLMSVVLMMSYAGRGKGKNLLGEVIVVFCTVGILTVIAWLPLWVMIVAILIVVALFAGRISDMVSR